MRINIRKSCQFTLRLQIFCFAKLAQSSIANCCKRKPLLCHVIRQTSCKRKKITLSQYTKFFQTIFFLSDILLLYFTRSQSQRGAQNSRGEVKSLTTFFDERKGLHILALLSGERYRSNILLDKYYVRVFHLIYYCIQILTLKLLGQKTVLKMILKLSNFKVKDICKSQSELQKSLYVLSLREVP